MGEAIIARSGGGSSGGGGAIIKSYPVAAGHSVNVGDVVDVVNGKIQKTMGSSLPKIGQFNTELQYVNDICQIDNNRLLIFGSTLNTTTANFYIHIIDINNGNVLNRITVPSSICVGYSVASMLYMGLNTIVVFGYIHPNTTYKMPIAVATIDSNNDIAFGAPTIVNSMAIDLQRSRSCVKMTDDLLIFTGNSTGAYAIRINRASLSITLSANPFTPSPSENGFSCLDRISDNKFIFSKSMVSSQHSNIYYVEVTASLTFVQKAIITRSNVTIKSVTKHSDNSFITTEYNNNQSTSTLIGKYILSDTSISYQTGAYAKQNNLSSYVFGRGGIISVNGYILMSGSASGDYILRGISIKKNTDSIAIIYNSQVDFIYMAPSIDGVSVFGYDMFNNSITRVYCDDNGTLGDYINLSDNAIALSSGGPSDIVSVVFDGMVNLPGIQSGTKIKSKGIYGYSPFDGILNVESKYKSNIVTGEFTSPSYTSNLFIPLPFKAKVVIIFGGSIFGLSNSYTSEKNVLAIITETKVGVRVLGSASANNGADSRDSQTWANFLSITNDGFQVLGSIGSANSPLKIPGLNYGYIAIGG